MDPNNDFEQNVIPADKEPGPFTWSENPLKGLWDPQPMPPDSADEGRK